MADATAQAAESGVAAEKTESLWKDVWYSLRKNVPAMVSLAIIVLLALVAIVTFVAPQILPYDPYQQDLSASFQGPSAEHWFGTDQQGHDVFARTIYGARASILVGLLATMGTLVLGSALGLIAGYLGGIADTLISRLGDIFFAIPLLLAGIVFISSIREEESVLGIPTQGYFGLVLQVVLVLVIFGWPSVMRLMRSAVIQVKPNDYVQAARALGASPGRIIRQHVLPNAMAPAIVVSTINLGAYISVEATLSFLGIGLQHPAISWGVMINESLVLLRSGSAMHTLYFPALFLSLAVLAFIMLGDAVRDAFDPKSR